jgi:hypothetical protein
VIARLIGLWRYRFRSSRSTAIVAITLRVMSGALHTTHELIASSSSANHAERDGYFL